MFFDVDLICSFSIWLMMSFCRVLDELLAVIGVEGKLSIYVYLCVCICTEYYVICNMLHI